MPTLFLPAEWAPQAAMLMVWPRRERLLHRGRKADFVGVAKLHGFVFTDSTQVAGALARLEKQCVSPLTHILKKGRELLLPSVDEVDGCVVPAATIIYAPSK